MEEINVLMLLPAKEFRDEEYSIPRQILEEGGCNITVSSSSVRSIRGRFGLEINPDIQLEETKQEKYDGIVLVGGPGAQEYFRNIMAHELVKSFNDADKVVAAICIAPSTLANAGILSGKRATAYSTEIQNLKNQGALISAKPVPVEVSGNIITADGPQASKSFGETILKVLKEKKGIE